MSHYPRPDDLARAAAGDPPEPLHTRFTGEGTVKYWKEAKGYGAIACEATAPFDVWTHFSALEMPGFKSLVPGERVWMEYRRANQESFRYVADRVCRLDPTAGPTDPASASRATPEAG